jgi:hypothetical protein
MTTTSALFPALGAGDTVVAVVCSSIGVWLFQLLILRGVKEAAIINRIATIAKVVPILMFIVIVIAVVAFKADYFGENLWGGGDRSFSSIFEQAKGTMLITVFVFLGIEGASVYSRFARKREDVGRATVIGFLSVLSVFALVTLVSTLYTRDTTCWVYGGVTLNPLYWPARHDETLLMKAIYEFHPDYVGSQVWWGDPEQSWGMANIEGGDVLVPGAAAVLVGLVGAHVAVTGTGRDGDQVLRVLADRSDALNLDEGVRRVRIVDAYDHARVPRQGAPLGGVLAGVERQSATVHDEPHRRDQRSAVGRHVAEHRRTSALGHECDHVIGEFAHVDHGKRDRSQESGDRPIDRRQFDGLDILSARFHVSSQVASQSGDEPK